MKQTGWMAVSSAVVALALSGCGNKGGDEKKQGDEPGKGAAEQSPATARPAGESGGAAWKEGPQPSFRASWRSSGEASKGAELTGTLYVGPRYARLDIDNHPNVGGKASFIRPHDEDELWQINDAAKELSRALSGSWERHVFPTIVDEGEIDDLLEGDCPFGSSRRGCENTGSGEVASRPVETWTFGNRTIWIDPALRTALKEEYTPYRNNPKTQLVELSEIALGAQPAELFAAPSGYTCNAGSFCDDAPRLEE